MSTGCKINTTTRLSVCDTVGSKYTKAQAMARVRLRIQRFAKANCLRAKSSLECVEGVNQLTFENDRRFADDNIISGYLETVSKKCVRDLDCLGTQTYLQGPLRKGDNVDADFKGNRGLKLG